MRMTRGIRQGERALCYEKIDRSAIPLAIVQYRLRETFSRVGYPHFIMMTSPHTSPPLEDADYYRLLRPQIEFEDSLITQRLSWFVAAQSFLFTAYAITLNGPKESALPAFREQQQMLYHLIPVVAIASGVLIYLAIVGGVVAQWQLRRFLLERVPAERLAAFPPIQGVLQTRVLGMAAPLGLPLVFVMVWIFLFVRGVS